MDREPLPQKANAPRCVGLGVNDGRWIKRSGRSRRRLLVRRQQCLEAPVVEPGQQSNVTLSRGTGTAIANDAKSEDVLYVEVIAPDPVDLVDTQDLWCEALGHGNYTQVSALSVE